MKKIVIVMVVISFCLIMAGIAGAVEAVKKPVATMQQVPGTTQPVPILFCPTGWTKKANALVCVPSKPAPITCPKGYQYYEQLTCTGTGGMDYCKGCQVWCEKPPQVPN